MALLSEKNIIWNQRILLLFIGFLTKENKKIANMFFFKWFIKLMLQKGLWLISIKWAVVQHCQEEKAFAGNLDTLSNDFDNFKILESYYYRMRCGVVAWYFFWARDNRSFCSQLQKCGLQSGSYRNSPPTCSLQ